MRWQRREFAQKVAIRRDPTSHSRLIESRLSAAVQSQVQRACGLFTCRLCATVCLVAVSVLTTAASIRRLVASWLFASISSFDPSCSGIILSCWFLFDLICRATSPISEKRPFHRDFEDSSTTFATPPQPSPPASSLTASIVADTLPSNVQHWSSCLYPNLHNHPVISRRDLTVD